MLRGSVDEHPIDPHLLHLVWSFLIRGTQILRVCIPPTYPPLNAFLIFIIQYLSNYWVQVLFSHLRPLFIVFEILTPPLTTLTPTPPTLLCTPPPQTSASSASVPRYITWSRLRNMNPDHVGLDILHHPPSHKASQGHPSNLKNSQAQTDVDIALGKHLPFLGFLEQEQPPSNTLHEDSILQLQRAS